MAEHYSLKVILVGASGVGKTSLIASYLTNTFDSKTLPTVAATASCITIQSDDMQVDLQVWDTAGQERFQSISRMFYRESNVAFVCYDTGTVPTIGNWVAAVREESPECLIFLVTTKSDLLDAEALADQKVIGAQKRSEYSAKIHLLTSAVTGNGVRELFTEAAKSSQVVFRVDNPNIVVGQVAAPPNKSDCC
jgi:small GTP-binding protein